MTPSRFLRHTKDLLKRWRFRLRYGPGLKVGSQVYIEKSTKICPGKGSAVSIADGCEINEHCLLICEGGPISIGKNSYVGPFSVLYGHGGLKIGENVKVAASCIFIPSSHRFDRLDMPICEQGVTYEGIVIEDDVWLGSRVTILDGVTVAQGCVIGAGSVVTKSTERNGVYVGIPAKKIKQRGA